jgi:ribonuclease-3
MNDSLIDWIAEHCGHQMRDAGLLRAALTHGSHGDEDYQRLEFLGDRVLGLVIAKELIRRFPNEREGQLSHRLNRLVSGQRCAVIARREQLGQHLRLGKQARNDGAADSDNILGDVVESLIGAIYLDSDLPTAERFILALWRSEWDQLGGDNRHPKSVLQEWTAANRHKAPVYTLIETSGPDHSLNFTVEVEVPQVGRERATAASKQAAETAAASAFLEQRR